MYYYLYGFFFFLIGMNHYVFIAKIKHNLHVTFVGFKHCIFKKNMIVVGGHPYPYYSYESSEDKT